jgi:hypothetical protein
VSDDQPDYSYPEALDEGGVWLGWGWGWVDGWIGWVYMEKRGDISRYLSVCFCLGKILGDWLGMGWVIRMGDVFGVRLGIDQRACIYFL